jgi:hypothetical protein
VRRTYKATTFRKNAAGASHIGQDFTQRHAKWKELAFVRSHHARPVTGDHSPFAAQLGDSGANVCRIVRLWWN